MSPGSDLTVNVGPPRTATTTLQKHFFPYLTNYYVLQKQPYTPLLTSAATQLKEFVQYNNNRATISVRKLEKYIADMEIGKVQGGSKERQFMFSLLWYMATQAAEAHIIDERAAKLKVIIELVLRYCIKAASSCSATSGIFLTSESLGSSSAALHPTNEYLAPRYGHEIDIIASVWSKTIGGPAPKLSFCLREPIAYVASRYIRYYVNCFRTNAQPLNESTWVACQVELAKQNLPQSALFPAFHTSYLLYFNRIGYTRAYGFKELIHSQDLCSLLGLEGRNGISFGSFPRENNLITAHSSRDTITIAIRDALIDQGYLALLEKEQLFE